MVCSLTGVLRLHNFYSVVRSRRSSPLGTAAFHSVASRRSSASSSRCFFFQRIAFSGRRRFWCLKRIRYEWPRKARKLKQAHEYHRDYRGEILADNHPKTLRARRILRDLVPQSTLVNHPWDVHVIEGSWDFASVDVWGHIWISTRVWDHLGESETDDGLAWLIGHEMAHKVAEHTLEQQISKRVLVRAAIALLVVHWNIDITAVALAGVAWFHRYQMRRDEFEADYIGLMIMAKSRYNPRAAISWVNRRYFARKGMKLPWFFFTHPSHETRIAKLEKWLEQALDLMYEAKTAKARTAQKSIPNAVAIRQGRTVVSIKRRM